jgi:hypothetical protein
MPVVALSTAAEDIPVLTVFASSKAARTKARLGQSLSAAQHTEGHLQVVGVGEWRPTSTRPSSNAEPRLSQGQEES